MLNTAFLVIMVKIHIKRVVHLHINFFNNPFIAFYFIFPFYHVNGFEHLKIQNILIIINTFLLVLIYVCGKMKNIGLVWWAFFFAGQLLFSSFTNSGISINLLYAAFYGIRMIGFFLLANLYLSKKSMILLQVANNYISCLLLVNLAFQILAQDFWGYTESNNYRNFLVSDNELPFIAISYLCIVIFDAYVRKKDNWSEIIFKYIIAFSNLLFAWCASGIISMIALAVLLIVLVKKRHGILNFQQTIICIAALYCFLLFSDMVYWIDRITVQIFGKALSVGRVNVWHAAIENIKTHFFMGYGTSAGGRVSINFVNSVNHWYSHNFILEYFIQGGVVLFLLYLALLWKIRKRIEAHKENILFRQWICIFVSLHIAYLTEGTIVEPTQYIIFILGYYVSNFVEMRKAKEPVGGNEF